MKNRFIVYLAVLIVIVIFAILAIVLGVLIEKKDNIGYYDNGTKGGYAAGIIQVTFSDKESLNSIKNILAEYGLKLDYVSLHPPSWVSSTRGLYGEPDVQFFVPYTGGDGSTFPYQDFQELYQFLKGSSEVQLCGNNKYDKDNQLISVDCLIKPDVPLKKFMDGVHPYLTKHSADYLNTHSYVDMSFPEELHIKVPAGTEQEWIDRLSKDKRIVHAELNSYAPLP